MPDPFLDGPLSGADGYGHGRRLRVGVLSNPRSGGNRRGGQGVRKVLAAWPEVLQREACTPEEVAKALADFAGDGVELVVINGGDGTVHAALTAIGNAATFPRPPLLALLCAGTTSMLPRDVGFSGSPAAALPRILAWAQTTDASLVVRPRPVLRVQRFPPQAPLFGMFFGAGAICQGIRLFHARDNARGWRGELMPAYTMLRLLLSVLFGGGKEVPPVRSGTSLDGHPPEQRADLLILISTLERLFLGLRPYWGVEAGPLHYTAVGAEPRYLPRVLGSLFRRHKSRHAISANGYFSHNVREVQLDMAGDFTLDGELYTAGEGPVTIASAGPAWFLCPR